MARNFNWNYTTAHPLGESHVKDARRDEQMFNRETAVLDNAAAKAKLRERQRERHEFFQRNPYLLENCHD